MLSFVRNVLSGMLNLLLTLKVLALYPLFFVTIWMDKQPWLQPFVPLFFPRHTQQLLKTPRWFFNAMVAAKCIPSNAVFISLEPAGSLSEEPGELAALR